MEDRNIVLTVIGVVLVVAVAGVAVTFTNSSTGMYMIYPPFPTEGGIANAPDPGTQYIAIDDGMCVLALQRPATFETFVQRQCGYLNPGRQTNKADCMHTAKLESQLKCTMAPVFENIQQPQVLV